MLCNFIFSQTVQQQIIVLTNCIFFSVWYFLYFFIAIKFNLKFLFCVSFHLVLFTSSGIRAGNFVSNVIRGQYVHDIEGDQEKSAGRHEAAVQTARHRHSPVSRADPTAADGTNTNSPLGPHDHTP